MGRDGEGRSKIKISLCELIDVLTMHSGKDTICCEKCIVRLRIRLEEVLNWNHTGDCGSGNPTEQ